MSTNDKLIVLFVFAGMVITFVAVLAIVIDRYKKADIEKKEDERADAEEINQKILQMHDYGEFLSKELSEKQSEAMLMYEMLLEKEKKWSDTLPVSRSEAATKPVQSPVFASIKEEERNPFAFLAERTDKLPDNEKSRIPKPESVAKDGAALNDNAAIIALYAKGMSEEEIAKELQIGKGQVELVIRLFA